MSTDGNLLDIHGKCRREREELEAKLKAVEREHSAMAEYISAAIDALAAIDLNGPGRAADVPTHVAVSGRTSNEDGADVGATAAHEPGCAGWHTEDITCAAVAKLRADAAADPWHCTVSGTYHSFGGAEPGNPRMPLAARCGYGCGRTWGELEQERADSRAGQTGEEVGRG